jgi:hypothetical protein
MVSTGLVATAPTQLDIFSVFRPFLLAFQLHPLVVPQDSQTKQEPAGRMRTPQVEQ